MYLEIVFPLFLLGKTKTSFFWTRLKALQAVYSITLKKFTAFLIDEVSGAKVRTWIISLFVLIVESRSFVSCINLSEFTSLIRNKSTSSALLVPKLISSGATFNALAIFSWMVEIAVLSFLVPKLTLSDSGWACTFSGDIQTDLKHSNMLILSNALYFHYIVNFINHIWISTTCFTLVSDRKFVSSHTT